MGALGPSTAAHLCPELAFRQSREQVAQSFVVKTLRLFLFIDGNIRGWRIHAVVWHVCDQDLEFSGWRPLREPMKKPQSFKSKTLRYTSAGGADAVQQVARTSACEVRGLFAIDGKTAYQNGAGPRYSTSK